MAAEEQPFPAMSPVEVQELSEDLQERQARLKQEAAEASEEGRLDEALGKLTEAVSLGCAGALLYAGRAELLLRLGRPLAAINDCTAALLINPDSSKAFKIRARAHTCLESWKEAQYDFQECLRIDFDDGVADEARHAGEKLKEIEAAAASAARQRWEVVGGADRGGILVRTGLELKSPEAASRLATGSLLEELELVGERLRYRRLTGSGPLEGWISITLKDKVLACRVSASSLPEEGEVAPADGAEETELPLPAMSPAGIEELSEDAQERQAMLKQEAAEAQEAGDQELALEKLTQAIALGCATALMYSRRADMLLKAGRPKAAIRDCTAALGINPDSGKAFKTRARAHARLKHWTDAHSDFQEGLKIDYDQATYEESVSVAAKVREMQAVATARRVKGEEAESQRKLQEARAAQEARQRQLQAEEMQRAQEQAEKAKAMSRVTADPFVKQLFNKAKRDGFMSDFMSCKRGKCNKCKSSCEVYVWRPVRMNS
eukprot:TRINITY_DN48119_c0_g1_i1.p1 TRINITY_DN48119_c0_g1~~TRINITY_DN48119_c0_g1_i1.p1  ORF type:complete len:521 (+),score=159.50 TRINITY_DN48119_c0_g1_i1:86-1564(+)